MPTIRFAKWGGSSVLCVPQCKYSATKIYSRILLRKYLSVENYLLFLSKTGIGLRVLPRKHKSKSDLHLFLFSLNMHCQACGTRIARYLLCKVLFMKPFYSGWSYDIKVDFCQMLLFAVLMSQVTKGLDIMTSDVSWSQRLDVKSILLNKKQVKGLPCRSLPECVNDWGVVVCSLDKKHSKMQRFEP